MARKLRLEYPGAIYHVINRGNYRRDIFESDRAKAAFEKCLFEACEKSAWLLHSFVIMINHFHLLLETPEANLVSGMQWLQGTFASRFNRYRQDHGHLFQGRYHAIPVGESKPMGEVCDYHHLNPVKAGAVDIGNLGDYRYSSYWYLRNPRHRPDFLRVQTALECAGGIPDNPEGWDQYDVRLALQAEELAHGGPNGWEEHSKRLCSGWALGSKEFKEALVKEYGLASNLGALEAGGVQEVRQLRWVAALVWALGVACRPQEDARKDPKNAAWKLAVSCWMKENTQASNGWLSNQLHMGAPSALSRNLALYRQTTQATDPLWKKLTSISSV